MQIFSASLNILAAIGADEGRSRRTEITMACSVIHAGIADFINNNVAIRTTKAEEQGVLNVLTSCTDISTVQGVVYLLDIVPLSLSAIFRVITRRGRNCNTNVEERRTAVLKSFTAVGRKGARSETGDGSEDICCLHFQNRSIVLLKKYDDSLMLILVALIQAILTLGWKVLYSLR